MSFQSRYATEESYPVCFEVMKKLDEIFCEIPTLPDNDLDDRLEKVRDDFQQILSEIQEKVEQQDKKKFEKWVVNNK